MIRFRNHVGTFAGLLFLWASSMSLAAESLTLREAFKNYFSVGTAINRSHATGQSVGRRSVEQVELEVSLIKTQFNQITSENDMKWQNIHPRDGADGYNFGPADAFVDFGERHGLQRVGHTLVWHNQTPDGVFAGTIPPPESATPPDHVAPGDFRPVYAGPRASRDELLERMRDHIHQVVGRYKGKVTTWDVVNEALADGPPEHSLRHSLWLQIIGPDFIAKAFEYAHEADPSAILRYNDYGLEDPVKIQKLVTLIQSLQKQNVPIHAIGTQAHLDLGSASFERFDKSLTEIEKLGLPIHITELDIHSAEGGEQFSRTYEGVFRAIVKHRASVKIVTFWGVNDAVSWRRDGNPLLFDGNCQPKPAFDAVMGVAMSSLLVAPTSAEKTVNPTGSVPPMLPDSITSQTKSWPEVALRSPQQFYAGAEAQRIAENVLLYQRTTGGWPKNIPMHLPLSDDESRRILADKERTNDSTIDNGATILELKFLAKMVQVTQNDKYRDAFDKGLHYILSGQYENGGFPQFWPNPRGYSVHITYNDDAVVNVMTLLRDIAAQKTELAFAATPEMARRCQAAFEKGIDCILKTQIIKNGERTVWCQQHNAQTLAPAGARSYELPSWSSAESAGIVKLLLEIESPSDDIQKAIHGAMKWFDRHRIDGIRIESFTNAAGEKDLRVVTDADSSTPHWARFTDIETEKPFFCGRDGVPKSQLADIEHERRTGYAWYVQSPHRLFSKYAERFPQAATGQHIVKP